MSATHRALLAAEPDGTPARLVDRVEEPPRPGEVVVAVAWSSLNYKDALALTGAAPVARRFPLVCGIDLAGTVVASASDALAVGTPVVATGNGLGEVHDGGFAERVRLEAAWCVPLSSPGELRWAATVGTAGFTAMLSVLALERLGALEAASEALPVLVTGAAGGVGSFAVALLGAAGYPVVASTGRPEEADYLRRLGASAIVPRDDLLAGPARPLDKETYAAAVDVVGGETLARVVAKLASGGAVAACGLAGGADLATTVHPFILRGVTLAGINSVTVAPALRGEAWRRLRADLPGGVQDDVGAEIGLDEVIGRADDLLAGRVRGRLVIRVGPEVLAADPA